MSGFRRLSRHSYYDGGIGLIKKEYGLYVDESGKGEKETYYVVAGILAHQSRIDLVEHDIREVMDRHGWHGEPKFGCMMVDGKYPDQDRCVMGPAPEILDVIGDEQMPFFVAAVKKGEEMPDGYKSKGAPDSHNSEDHYATERVVLMAIDYVAGEQSHVRITRDRGNDETDRRIRKSLNKTGRSGAGDVISNLDMYRGYESADSEKNPGLWLADCCAGAVSRSLNWHDPACYERIRWLHDARHGGMGRLAIYPPPGGI